MNTQKFINLLKKSPKRNDVFNPWWHVDPDNDAGQNSPKIRRVQLKQYLDERIGKAKMLILGEALGYQGGHFSGMAMTSERILLGGLKNKGLYPQQVFENLEPKRTSKVDVKPNGFTEPTATVVWGFMMERGISPKDFIIWNAFPWHPFKKEKGFLSNRTPKEEEFIDGKFVLEAMTKLNSFDVIVAVGENAYQQLLRLGINCVKVRHPANGGVPKFREQMDVYLKKIGY